MKPWCSFEHSHRSRPGSVPDRHVPYSGFGVGKPAQQRNRKVTMVDVKDTRDKVEMAIGKSAAKGDKSFSS